MSRGKYEAARVSSTQSDSPRPWDIIKIIFTLIVMLAAVAMMIFTVVSVAVFDRNDRELFGYKAFIVRSDSMSATDFSAGDLILLKEVDPSTLQPGDIIAFRSTDPASLGETFTHKIREITTDDAGEPVFITYGTTTNTDDPYPVTYDQVQGKYQFAIPGIGSFFTFLKTVPGYICCILLPFLLLILVQGCRSIRLFRQYREEQLAEINADRRKEMEEIAVERERLAVEREESQRMLAELQKLQAQLTGTDFPAEETGDELHTL